jgi:hypothetical protein
MEFTLSEIIKATGAQVIKNELKGDEKFTFSTDTLLKKAKFIYPSRAKTLTESSLLIKRLKQVQ